MNDQRRPAVRGPWSRPLRSSLRRFSALATAALVLPVLAGGLATPARADDGTTPSGSPAAGSSAVASAGVRTAVRGWTIARQDARTWQVTWTSPTRLPLGGDRPTVVAVPGTSGLLVGPPTLDPDGTTVRATVTAARAPRPAELDVVLSGRSLVRPAIAPGTGGRGPEAPTRPWTAPTRTLWPPTPAWPGTCRSRPRHLPVAGDQPAGPSRQGRDGRARGAARCVRSRPEPSPRAAPARPAHLLLRPEPGRAHLRLALRRRS